MTNIESKAKEVKREIQTKWKNRKSVLCANKWEWVAMWAEQTTKTKFKSETKYVFYYSTESQDLSSPSSDSIVCLFHSFFDVDIPISISKISYFYASLVFEMATKIRKWANLCDFSSFMLCVLSKHIKSTIDTLKYTYYTNICVYTYLYSHTGSSLLEVGSSRISNIFCYVGPSLKTQYQIVKATIESRS